MFKDFIVIKKRKLFKKRKFVKKKENSLSRENCLKRKFVKKKIKYDVKEQFQESTQINERQFCDQTKILNILLTKFLI